LSWAETIGKSPNTQKTTALDRPYIKNIQGSTYTIRKKTWNCDRL